MIKQSGYYRFPTVAGNRVVFVCEDDLWSVSLEGGIATRLTSNLGEVTHPFLSPDGTQLAFVGREEGHLEVYVMPADGGVARRLTYLAADSSVVGWSQDGTSIIFASNTAQAFNRIYKLYKINTEGGFPENLPLGLAHHISYSANGGRVLGRNTNDIARWKRYRGGRAGVLWIDVQQTGIFQKLINLPGNLASPMWIKDRIYFISDHEGIGNIHSCTTNGLDLKQHTNSRDYYVRNATTDSKSIVYQAGAELFYFNPATEEHQQIQIDFRSPQIQRQRKFVDATRYVDSYAIHPDGQSTIITSRGKSFCFGNWEGGVTQIGIPDGVRYRLTCWLNDKKRFVTISDSSGVEAIEIHTPDPKTPPERLEELDLGRVIRMNVSPVADLVVLSNHRHELILANLTTKQSQVIERSEYHPINSFCWSPDGNWIAYSFADNSQVSTIKLFSVENGNIHCLTEPSFWDFCPSFDPEGKFIYFISCREFNPVRDNHYFDWGFPSGMRPYLIALKKDTPSPFLRGVEQPAEKSKQNNNNSNEKTKNGENNNQQDQLTNNNGEEKTVVTPFENQKTSTIEIDFDGIVNRVIAFPVAEGNYRQIWGIKGKVLFTSFPIKSSLDENNNPKQTEDKASLLMYDFDQQKQDTIATEVTDFQVASASEMVIYSSKNRLQTRLRVCKVAAKSNVKLEDEPGRKTGWLDLRRLRISILPRLEWQQMFKEAWRLQKEHFWVEDMSGVDWDKVNQRYQPLLEKVTTRSEFSDLIWEMQGELGTSHAYESGGDYRYPPYYGLGLLGADFSYDAEADAYRVEHIVRGDSWNEKADSPLNRLGANVQVGDLLVAINGQRVSKEQSPHELLVNQADFEVTLTFATSTADEYRTITVKTLRSETKARYREWVEYNRRIIHEKTDGRVGYVHVPDMKAVGYGEFHRYYHVEAQKEALIVDVRYNAGGNVSQLLLEKLSRKPISYKFSRWRKPFPYPNNSMGGPILTITNEYAASDGDIFSHCFKLMKLGTLIGKRTWGGVIGITQNQHLVDGGIVKQPEFSSWFPDVTWGVENYGTEPDIEVEITPQDWAENKDPQLDKAIEVILQQLSENPVQLPDFTQRPRLNLPD
jgi:tricorn protease